MKKAATTLLASAGALSAMLVMAPIAGAAPQQADAERQQAGLNPCNDKADILCLFDVGTWNYGQIYDTNASWNFTGGNNWNNRADVFMNNRVTQDSCVYSGVNATGTIRRIPAGQQRSISNFGSSNKWVSPGASCG